ncbi:MAG: glycoside hydrolase family 2 protein [candidate division KSB1 bacterium]|nr:glycoside hydrolase family 2 protein [candidate division KSB1 bacterium]MDZ7304198.1 glycoside hydrolase family 2 protein [candidate division KSB1 bacterium]MDZ7313432.1 glycoside hydrolase family 2 protein [candidate division KSB1 bacterium]
MSHFQLEHWKFHKGDIHSAESPRLASAEGWQEVIVPHTWNAKDVLTEGERYYQGIGWYRTSFTIRADESSTRTFIRFEGVSLVADVFLNGAYVGRHKGGYSAFCFEITPYVVYGEENVLSVKVDNTMQPDVAPSGTHLYPLFGGIYRPVTVFQTNDLCVSPLDYASSGVTVRPLQVSKEEAEIAVETLLNYRHEPQLQTVSPELLPPKGMKGRGLYGEYFDNDSFRGKPKHIRIDEAVSFNYGRSGAYADMPLDNFSVRWTGRMIPARSGLCRFVLKSDDGSRLYIDDRLVIDHWGAHAATERSCDVRLEAGKEVRLKLEYNEFSQDASIKFGWKFFDDSASSISALLETSLIDREKNTVAEERQPITLQNNEEFKAEQRFHLDRPHLWNAKADPYLYTLNVRLEDAQGNILDEVEQPFGLRFYRVDRDSGLVLNGRAYPLYGVSRHQEWEGLGPALSDKHHEKDVSFILELGATGVRLAHYQQADKMYSLCDENGLVVWAEIPNTPAYRKHPDYLQNCKDQLTELIKQNINHPSILFWGLYNEVDIPTADLKILHDTAKRLDPHRLTTQADYSQVSERHLVTDVAAWNWYYGWYYGQFGEYAHWFDRAHQNYPTLLAGLSEYGAGGCISQQQENPARPDASNGRFFPEQYQRLYHEKVWSEIKDRKDLWCKFIWNLADFSWTNVRRGDRDFINHKGLITHDRKVKKDAFYFYKANWSAEPVLYLLSRRNTERTEKLVPIEVYTNLDEVELYVNGVFVSKKKMESDIHKIRWENVALVPGRNRIDVIGHQGEKTYTDACEWRLHEIH